eukprot:COSAG03_NODE_6705_length_1017_cov_2.777778_1_plen_105_part_00
MEPPVEPPVNRRGVCESAAELAVGIMMEGALNRQSLCRRQVLYRDPSAPQPLAPAPAPAPAPAAAPHPHPPGRPLRRCLATDRTTTSARPSPPTALTRRRWRSS